MIRIIFHRLLTVGFLMALGVTLSGCEPITRHKVISTIFDGVPTLPPPAPICTGDADKMVAPYRDEISKKSAPAALGLNGSKHPPYVEKRCDDCHDKTKENGLVGPRNEFCFICHTGFVKGTYVHGPVAVGDCLACHEPHNSNFPSLLKVNKATVCASCHMEKRLAQGMHEKVRDKGVGCMNCHDPHSTNAPFFLK